MCKDMDREPNMIAKINNIEVLEGSRIVDIKFIFSAISNINSTKILIAHTYVI